MNDTVQIAINRRSLSFVFSMNHIPIQPKARVDHSVASVLHLPSSCRSIIQSIGLCVTVPRESFFFLPHLDSISCPSIERTKNNWRKLKSVVDLNKTTRRNFRMAREEGEEIKFKSRDHFLPKTFQCHSIMEPISTKDNERQH